MTNLNRKAKHSAQFKAQVLAYKANHPELSTTQISKQFGLGNSTLFLWQQQALKQQSKAAHLSSEQLRLKQLEKENAHLREVNEILKKAHVYFVNNPSK